MLLSIGVLSVGMIFVAGVFPVAIYFSTVSTERTMAAVVADEAFAKIKIYAEGDPNDIIPPGDDVRVDLLRDDRLQSFSDANIFRATDGIEPNEFTYPSDLDISLKQKQYYWSALCRLSESDVNNPNPPVQVTVFVCRKVAQHLEYYKPNSDGEVDWSTPEYTNRPVPVKVEVSQLGLRDNELRIRNSDEKSFINDGYTIVDDKTGRIYRVLKRYPENDDTILLDKDWCDDCGDAVWVVPPPENGSRGPCIAVYQRVIQF